MATATKPEKARPAPSEAPASPADGADRDQQKDLAELGEASEALADWPWAPGSVAELREWSPALRLEAYLAGKLNRRMAMTWAALFPDEVPTVNGELPWIALTLADLD